MMNPYITLQGVPWDGIPVKRSLEKEAIREGFAINKARGFRVPKKGRQQIKTKASRLSQREAA